VVEARWSSANDGKAKIDAKESDAECVCVCVCDGIGKESFTTRCYRPVKLLLLTSTVNNWKDYAKQSRKSDQNWSIRQASSSITTMPDLTSLAIRQKLRKLSWEVSLMQPPYSPDLASDYHLFRSLQNSHNGVKLTSKEAWKSFVAVFCLEIIKVL